MKDALSSMPMLSLHNFSKDLIVEIDASSIGIGVVLCQDNHPIALFSQNLLLASTYNHEMFVITQAVQKWRQYLLSHHFLILTDQQSLTSLTSQIIQPPEQQCWLRKLSGYDFEICSRPGEWNSVADALSRVPTMFTLSLAITKLAIYG